MGLDLVSRVQSDSYVGVGRIRTPSNVSDSCLDNTNKIHTKQAQKLAQSDTYNNRENGNLNKTDTSSECHYGLVCRRLDISIDLFRMQSSLFSVCKQFW